MTRHVNVKVRRDLIPTIDKLIREGRDKLGLKKHRSRSDVADKALRAYLEKELLKKPGKAAIEVAAR